MEKNFRPRSLSFSKTGRGYSKPSRRQGRPDDDGRHALETFRRYVKPDATAED